MCTLRKLAGYVALAALFLGYPFALTWPRMTKLIKVGMKGGLSLREDVLVAYSRDTPQQ